MSQKYNFEIGEKLVSVEGRDFDEAKRIAEAQAAKINRNSVTHSRVTASSVFNANEEPMIMPEMKFGEQPTKSDHQESALALPSTL